MIRPGFNLTPRQLTQSPEGKNWIALPGNNDFASLMKSLGFADTNFNLRSLLGSSNKFANVSTVLDSQAVAAGVGNGADATDDTLFSTSLTKGILDSSARGLLVLAAGTSAANGNNKTLQVILGATSLFSSGTMTINAKNWMLAVLIQRLASNVQLGAGLLVPDATTPIAKIVTNGAEDLTTTLTLKLTGKSGSSAASDLVANQYAVIGLPWLAVS
jgi:hypothetical protein